jgi:hypothetical protein
MGEEIMTHLEHTGSAVGLFAAAMIVVGHPAGDWDNMGLWRNRAASHVNPENDRLIKIIGRVIIIDKIFNS